MTAIEWIGRPKVHFRRSAGANGGKHEGKRVAAAYFEKHARDLEALMSVLSAKKQRQLYASLKKLGLRAAQKLDGARQTVQEQERY